jgi:hypothetical protein
VTETPLCRRPTLEKKSIMKRGGERWSVRSVHHFDSMIEKNQKRRRAYILKREREEEHQES